MSVNGAYKKTYNPCDECPYGIDKRDGSGNDSQCKICEFKAILDRSAFENKALTCEGCKYQKRIGFNYENCMRCNRYWPDRYETQKPESEKEMMVNA